MIIHLFDVSLIIIYCTFFLKLSQPWFVNHCSYRKNSLSEWLPRYNVIYIVFSIEYKICYFRITLFSFLITSLNLTFPMVHTTVISIIVTCYIIFSILQHFYLIWCLHSIINWQYRYQFSLLLLTNSEP